MALEQFWAGAAASSGSPTTSRWRGDYEPPPPARPGPRAVERRLRRALVRPDDSRYGQNPNRMQQHYQYRSSSSPTPATRRSCTCRASRRWHRPARARHPLRGRQLESPALGAWGLGWEVWLDGQEITQFTYFQQAGSVTLDPVRWRSPTVSSASSWPCRGPQLHRHPVDRLGYLRRRPAHG